jgi:integrase
VTVHRRTDRAGYVVRWREGARQRSRAFDRKRDADLFDAEVRRRRQLGGLELLDAGSETLGQYVAGTWAPAHAAPLAPKTQRNYACLYDLHIHPWLSGTPLRELNPEAIARWQSALLTAGVPVETVRKAHTLLGGILQRALEGRRIATNPQRLVRKPPPAAREEVRPMAPETVERLRAVLRTLGGYQRSAFIRQRDATLVSLLAYAGVRPEEARLLRWQDVGERTLLVTSPKTKRVRPRRTVRLLTPLRQDLLEWQLALGRPGARDPVIPDVRGGPWSETAYNLWRGRAWRDALQLLGQRYDVPYVLRHSFASLLLHEGRSVIYVARQLGHGAALTTGTYGHVIEELDGAPHIDAEDAIRAARQHQLFPQRSPEAGDGQS